MTDFLELTNAELNLEVIRDLVSSPDCGAISIFIGNNMKHETFFPPNIRIYYDKGTTRDNMAGKKVTRLEYEAYESMAIKEMKKVCDEIREKWRSIRNIAIYHRLGLVQIQQSSIIIAISAPHRKDSLDAVHYCIDRVKEKVPVWKKV
jgi:molybdopterin synthase catalytic subunit